MALVTAVVATMHIEATGIVVRVTQLSPFTEQSTVPAFVDIIVSLTQLFVFGLTVLFAVLRMELLHASKTKLFGSFLFLSHRSITQLLGEIEDVKAEKLVSDNPMR
jgi:hypothetical protein